MSSSRVRIEKALSDRHLRGAMLTLYDVSSTYFEGRCCLLAKLGTRTTGST
jgi:hypothetical protein